MNLAADFSSFLCHLDRDSNIPMHLSPADPSDDRCSVVGCPPWKAREDAGRSRDLHAARAGLLCFILLPLGLSSVAGMGQGGRGGRASRTRVNSKSSACRVLVTKKEPMGSEENETTEAETPLRIVLGPAFRPLYIQPPRSFKAPGGGGQVSRFSRAEDQ